MKHYVKCTYGKGIFPNEKAVSFRVTKQVKDPLMRGDGMSFSYFISDCNLQFIDKSNALLHVEPLSVSGNEALVSFWVSGDGCRCFVPLEDIVEKEVKQ